MSFRVTPYESCVVEIDDTPASISSQAARGGGGGGVGGPRMGNGERAASTELHAFGILHLHSSLSVGKIIGSYCLEMFPSFSPFHPLTLGIPLSLAFLSSHRLATHFTRRRDWV